jgi:hypothetical protein
MRALLIGAAATIAAIAIPGGPATAADTGGGFVGIPSASVNSGFGNGFRHDRRRNRGLDGAILYYDREYQGDTAWRSDSFNDWWHERPNRSYPAWVLRNQDCQRKWRDGAVLRC